uniref:Uncharacterized protein n=1 Tax=Ascaris lumbricoides TaxID=6252 RepID=A0A9J2P761_ASCLU
MPCPSPALDYRPTPQFVAILAFFVAPLFYVVGSLVIGLFWLIASVIRMMFDDLLYRIYTDVSPAIIAEEGVTRMSSFPPSGEEESEESEVLASESEETIDLEDACKRQTFLPELPNEQTISDHPHEDRVIGTEGRLGPYVLEVFNPSELMSRLRPLNLRVLIVSFVLCLAAVSTISFLMECFGMVNFLLLL